MHLTQGHCKRYTSCGLYTRVSCSKPNTCDDYLWLVTDKQVTKFPNRDAKML